jgi:hypothetical protein
MLVFGCATVKEMEVGQKYEDSKSWFKEKLQAMGAKKSSTDDDAHGLEPYPKNSKYLVYRTQWSYETLPGIAEWFTGDSGNWKALARPNPGLNPNRIAIDNRINIPPEMMKTKKPLPRKVIAKTLSGYFAHTVIKMDEKLSDIAQWYTGSASNQKVLAAANPDIDPDFLLVGNEIYVPPDLLKTKAPLGQKTTRKTDVAPEKASTNKAATSTPETNKIRLFGPRQFQAN